MGSGVGSGVGSMVGSGVGSGTEVSLSGSSGANIPVAELSAFELLGDVLPVLAVHAEIEVTNSKHIRIDKTFFIKSHPKKFIESREERFMTENQKKLEELLIQKIESECNTPSYEEPQIAEMAHVLIELWKISRESK